MEIVVRKDGIKICSVSAVEDTVPFPLFQTYLSQNCDQSIVLRFEHFGKRRVEVPNSEILAYSSQQELFLDYVRSIIDSKMKAIDDIRTRKQLLEEKKAKLKEMLSTPISFGEPSLSSVDWKALVYKEQEVVDK